MTTPRRSTETRPQAAATAGPTPGGGQSNTPEVWVLRILSALVVPAVLVVFFFSFGFLKDPDVNKFLQVVVARRRGILGVWALYWGMDRAGQRAAGRGRGGVRPFIFAGPAMVLLGFYLVYPAINTLRSSAFQDADSESVRRLWPTTRRSSPRAPTWPASATAWSG